MSASQRVVALLVGLVVVLAVVVVGLRGGLHGVAAATPSPVPATATPSGSPIPDSTPAAGDDPDELLATFAEIEESVREIRGLPAPDIGPPEILTRDAMAAEFRELFDEDYPPEERRADNIALRAMGLLGPDEDYAALYLELLTSDVLGFYDDEEKRMVIVTDAGLDAQAKMTYAHEYTHALQDAAFGLAGLEIDAEGQDDRGLARLSLVEGDATLTMFVWAFAGGLSEEELVEFGQTSPPDLPAVPDWMIAAQTIPYLGGLQWAQSLYLSDEFASIDAAFADPPDSTEQILHVDKWRDREAPDSVAAPALAAELGEGWQEVDATPIGEAVIAIWLEHLGVDPAVAAGASAGWGGDRSVVAAGPDDAFALSWVFAWDTDADADEFVAAYSDAMSALDFPATVERLASGEVVVAHASSEDLLDGALAAARDR